MTDLVWHTEKRKVKDLKPFEGNPRLMTKEQAEQLLKSIKKFNLVEIPVINTDNTILAGHQRINALLSLGRGNEEIEVRVPNRKLTEEEAKEYLLRSNKNVGEWDWDLLANFDVDFLKNIGWNEKELGLNSIEENIKEINSKMEKKMKVKVKIFYFRPEDWILWKNQICNFLNEKNINYELEE